MLKLKLAQIILPDTGLLIFQIYFLAPALHQLLTSKGFVETIFFLLSPRSVPWVILFLGTVTLLSEVSLQFLVQAVVSYLQPLLVLVCP